MLSLDNCLDIEIKAQIRGVDVNIRTFDYVFEAYLGEHILGPSDNLSKLLLLLLSFYFLLTFT